MKGITDWNFSVIKHRLPSVQMSKVIGISVIGFYGDNHSKDEKRYLKQRQFRNLIQHSTLLVPDYKKWHPEVFNLGQRKVQIEVSVFYTTEKVSMRAGCL